MDRLSRQTGFTLIELVVVILLMGILVTGAYLAWPGATTNLYAEAWRLSNNLRYTQALSMTRGQRYRLVKTSSTTYQIQNSTGTAITIAMGSTTVTLGSGITFGTLTNLPNSLVVFDGLGVPYTDTGSPGTALAATASFTVTANGETRTISITPQTGRVTVS